MDESILVFSRVLSQNSLWKLFTFRGYKGIYNKVCDECEKSYFCIIGHSSNSVSWVEWVTILICKLTAWSDYIFCPVVLQLSWPFSFLHASHVWRLASHKSVARSSRETSLNAHNLIFFTFSHTQPLHNSHLNTGYLIAKIQANLAQNKANTWLNKFNLTKMNYHILISSFFGNEVVASLLLRFKKSQCCTKTQNNTKDWNLEKKKKSIWAFYKKGGRPEPIKGP